MITVGSLFSGIGGIELGLERTGSFRTLWFCESEKYCQAILKKHWPDVPIIQDIRTADWSGVERPEMLAGGFPCQDLSYAGKGFGIKEGTRSGLWYEFARAIRALRPRIVLVENVPGIITRGLNIVLADLAEEGYDAEWFDLRASDVGAPHKRARIFIIAYTNSSRCNNWANLGENMGYKNFKLWKVKEEQRNEGWRILRSIENSKMAMREASKSLDIEPLLSGDHDGISETMDRIRCLGNAVVPQVAEQIGKMIKVCIMDEEQQEGE